MRPVEKLQPGMLLPSGHIVRSVYRPFGDAEPVLEENIGHYCSYCEIFSSDLDLEHVVSRFQDETLQHDWANFLLACKRCNGRDNKSNKPVDPNLLYLPHLNNTLLAFDYLEGGVVQAASNLSVSQLTRAVATIDLIGLDKTEEHHGRGPRDKRWQHRREAWEIAMQNLEAYEQGRKTAERIAISAAQRRGFFSIWFTVFDAHLEVKKQLAQKFPGTALACFDENFNLVPRNILLADSI